MNTVVVPLWQLHIEITVHLYESDTRRVIGVEQLYAGPFAADKIDDTVLWARVFSRRANAASGGAYWIKARPVRTDLMRVKETSYCVDASVDPEVAGIGFTMCFEDYLRRRYPSRYRTERHPL